MQDEIKKLIGKDFYFQVFHQNNGMTTKINIQKRGMKFKNLLEKISMLK